MKIIYFLVMLTFFDPALVKAAAGLTEQEAVKTFEAIQAIGLMLQKVARCVEGNDIELDETLFSKCNPCGFSYKTNEGICLIIDTHLEKLATPWGEIEIRFNRTIKNEAELFNKLIKHIKLEFLLNFEEGCYEPGYEPVRFYLDDFSNEIQEGELKQYRRSDRRIIADTCNTCSLYEIKRVGDMEVPELHPQSFYMRGGLLLKKQEDAIKKSWNEMMERYKTKNIKPAKR